MNIFRCALAMCISGFLWGQSIGCERGLEIIKIAESQIVLPKKSPDGLYELRVYTKDQDVLLEYIHESGIKFLYRFDGNNKFEKIAIKWRKSKDGFRLLIGKDAFMFVVAILEGKVS